MHIDPPSPNPSQRNHNAPIADPYFWGNVEKVIGPLSRTRDEKKLFRFHGVRVVRLAKGQKDDSLRLPYK